MRVEPFVGDPQEWDRFVRGAIGSTHCHLYGWKRVMEDVFRHECLYLSVSDPDGQVRGVLPLVRVKSILFGHYLVSMPFLNDGGPLGDEEAIAALLEAAAARADRDRAGLLELRSRRELAAAATWSVSFRKVTVRLDLPTEREELWSALAAKVRSQVRRPRKEGVEVRHGPEQADPFYTVFARHMRDLGTPVLPRGWFGTIRDVFGDDVWFAAAYLAGRPIAAGCAIRWNDEVEVVWASALREHSRKAANMLLYWSFMERAIDDGLRVFDFGRCTPGGGTHRFKLQWGGREEKLWWYYRARGTRASTPSPQDAGLAWGPRLWRRLPVSLATTLGPRVVRFLP